MKMGHGKPTEGIVGAAIEFPQFFSPGLLESLFEPAACRTWNEARI
jgi:hypothetical protein